MSARPSHDVRSLLLVRNDRIGDLVLTLPAFEAARKALPRAHIAALVSPYTAPLLRRNTHLDEIVLDEPAAGGWELGRRLAKGRFDAAAVINTNTRNCLAVWRARIPTRVCWAHKPAGLILATHRVRLHRSRPIHEAEFALAFVRSLGLPAEMAGLRPRLDVDPAARARAAGKIRSEVGEGGDNSPLFGMVPTSGGSAYNWPLARYADLASRLALRGRVMVTGTPRDRPALARMRDALPARVRPRVGVFTGLDLAELAGALAEADVVTASSTGPMHIAGAIGTPVVALFSPNPVHSPAKWAPFGERNVILVPPLREGEEPDVPASEGEAYMERITVEEVVSANLGLLGPG